MNEEIEEYFLSYEDDLNKQVERLNFEYGTLRVGRANPKMLDRVYVDYYGTKTPINQTANIGVADARMLTVSPWDVSLLKGMKSAIMEANLGFGVSDDGKMIRLSLPMLTEERRRELSKEARKMLEDVKVGMRNARRDVLDIFKDMKKNSTISEDEFNSIDKRVQKMLDDYIAKVDVMCEKKTADIMEV